MKTSIPFALSFVALLTAACSVTTTESPDGGSSTTSPDGGGGTSPDGAAQPEVPAASTKEAPVEIGAACPAFSACGGSIDGTYDYASGCVGDVLADVKKACPTVDGSGLKVVVKGSLHFTGGKALTRDATSTLSGTIKVPAMCAQGQCSIVEKTLRDAGFATATCTGAAGCDCTVAKTESTKNATTYAVSGTTVTTADGETYAFCAKGNALSYTGKSAGSEDGAWELTKR
jgi:hypothetical protein